MDLENYIFLECFPSNLTTTVRFQIDKLFILVLIFILYRFWCSGHYYSKLHLNKDSTGTGGSVKTCLCIHQFV